MILFVCFIVLCVIFLIKYSFSKKKNGGNHKSLYDIPSPGCLPILGNLSDLFCNDEELWKRNTERAVEWYPIYRLGQFNRNIVYLVDPEDVEIILDKTKFSVKGPLYDTLRRWTGRGLICSEGSFWQKHRKLLTKSFHFGVLREYTKIFNKHIDSLIGSFKNQTSEPIEVISPITHMTLRIINEAIFGEKSNVKKEDLDIYSAAIKTITKIISYKSMRPYVNYFHNFSSLKRKEDKALEIIYNFSKKLLKNYDDISASNDSENNKKIVDIMLKNPDVFDNESLVDEINTFTFGGHDTTSTALTFVLLILANYPEYQDILYQEIIAISEENQPTTHAEITNMNFLDRFLKECLRIFPPVTFIGRELVEDIVTKTGYELPAGTIIIIDIFNLHRNSRVFPEPEKFNPDRFLLDNIAERHPYAYLPFSAGPRNCIAQKFAVLELKTSICAILKKFVVEPGDRIEDIEFIPDPILQTKNKIKVKFTHRTL